MRGTEARSADEAEEVESHESRLDDSLVERALDDLGDDLARTGVTLADDDVNRAAARHDLSIFELGELRRRAAERGLTESSTVVVSPLEDVRSQSARGDRAGDTTDTLRWLFDQLNGFPLLDAADEIVLARAIENGARAEAALSGGSVAPNRGELEWAVDEGLGAKKRMVASNIRLAIANAKDFRGRGLDFEDLIQAAIPGLIRAAEKFDHRRGFKFSTYATWWIRQSISRALANTGRTIRLPVHVVTRLNKFRAARSKLEGRLGREPSPGELAEQLDWDLAEVTALIESIPVVVSLDAPVGGDADAPALAEYLASEAPSPYEQTVDTLRSELVHDLLDELESRQRRVIELRHGLAGHPHTLDEVAKKFGITRERVRQIERDAMGAMRRRGEEVGLLA